MPAHSHSNQSGGLRSRKLDPKRHLPVFRHYELNDLDESASRTIPQVATGVEKEEEEEHHLQAALVSTYTQVVIPTPDASKLIDTVVYNALYDDSFHLPKTLVKFSMPVEDAIGCPYNLDEVDESWFNSTTVQLSTSEPTLLKSEISAENLEWLLFSFELAANEKIRPNVTGSQLSPQEWNEFLQGKEIAGLEIISSIPTQLVELVYNYWAKRRYDENLGQPILPILKGEEMVDKPDADPYVCFRRREMKQLRRARRADSQALEKLQRLRSDLEQAKEILELVRQREVLRQQAVEMDQLIFEKRIYLRRLKRRLGITSSEKDLDVGAQTDGRKKKRGDDSESTKIRIPMQKLRDAANLVSELDNKLFLENNQASLLQAQIEDKVRRLKAADEKAGYVDLTEGEQRPSPLDLGWQTNVSFSTVQNPHRQRIPYCRRRIGRGGRLWIDRHVHIPKDLCKIDDTLVDQSETSIWKDALERVRSDPVMEGLESILSTEILRETPNTTAYRAFSIAPRDDEYRLLMNKPSHPPQILCQPTPPDKRTLPAPPNVQVIRAPVTAGGSTNASLKKKASKGGNSNPQGNEDPAVDGSAGDAGTNSKKKVDPPVDKRTAAVKAMMQVAQRQAQQQQALSKLAAAGGNVPSGQMSPLPSLGTPSQTTTGNNALLSPFLQSGSPVLTPGSVGANPGVTSGITEQGLKNANVNALQQLRLQQQIRLQQQLAASGLLGSGSNPLSTSATSGISAGSLSASLAASPNIPSLNNNLLSQIQLQQLYMNQQQQILQNRLRMLSAGNVNASSNVGSSILNLGGLQAQAMLVQQHQQQTGAATGNVQAGSDMSSNMQITEGQDEEVNAGVAPATAKDSQPSVASPGAPIAIQE